MASGDCAFGQLGKNMLLVIDNYDSFTYNLVQYFGELGQQPQVYRNDAIDLQGIADLKPQGIVLSPGPCTPNEAGISLAVIHAFAGQIPILGVCLGHQAIGQAFGGRIIRAKRLMHGKTSLIYHEQQNLFAAIQSPFTATRYHSLVIDQQDFPPDLTITAWTQEPNGEREEIMAVAHREWPVFGVQFHPESILSEHGHRLLQNFLAVL
jgi:anthranilate synthase component 2